MENEERKSAIIQMSAEGIPPSEIAKTLNTSKQNVSAYRQRYANEILDYFQKHYMTKVLNKMTLDVDTALDLSKHINNPDTCPNHTPFTDDATLVRLYESHNKSAEKILECLGIIPKTANRIHVDMSTHETKTIISPEVLGLISSAISEKITDVTLP